MADPEQAAITAAQREARRNNGKASRGPKTAEGKRASSRNAICLGLYATANPVVETGALAEDPQLYQEQAESLRLSMDAQTVLEELLVDQLNSILWRMRRIPALEAAMLADQSLEQRRADRAREQVQEMLVTEAYLRDPDTGIGGEDFYAAAGWVHTWAGWPFAEAWTAEDEGAATEEERRSLFDRLLKRRWESWDDAADHALDQAEEAMVTSQEERRDNTARQVRVLISNEALSQLNRPESHLSRERDRLLNQLRLEQEARTSDESD